VSDAPSEAGGRREGVVDGEPDVADAAALVHDWPFDDVRRGDGGRRADGGEERPSVIGAHLQTENARAVDGGFGEADARFGRAIPERARHAERNLVGRPLDVAQEGTLDQFGLLLEGPPDRQDQQKDQAGGEQELQEGWPKNTDVAFPLRRSPGGLLRFRRLISCRRGPCPSASPEGALWRKCAREGPCPPIGPGRDGAAHRLALAGWAAPA